MTSEPDNKMDELLKTYARKRRDEAGAPSEMHPATRKLLQAEAAKLRPPAPERKESWFSALLAFWPRYAVAATVFVVLGVGAWTFFHFEEQPKQLAMADAGRKVQEPARDQVTAEKKERAGQYRETVGQDSVRRLADAPNPAEPQVALREEANRLKALADESKTKRNEVELAAANDALPRNLALNRPAPAAAPASVPPPITPPPSPLAKAGTRQLAAVDAKDKGALDGSQARLDNYSKLPLSPAGTAAANAPNLQSRNATETDALGRQNSLALAPAAKPSTPASVVAGTGTAGGLPRLASPQTDAATGAERFYSRQDVGAQTSQTSTPARNRFSQFPSNNRGAPAQRAGAAAASVLAEFDFEQNGNQVRVVDADGSVYHGQIEDAAQADDNSKERARSDTAQTVELRKAVVKQTAPAEAAPTEAPAWNFRATGTNRTLQQPVTINGVFYANSTNLGGPAAQTARGVLQTVPQPANATLPSVQRIQGRVQVGTGAETQLDAVRRANDAR